MKDFTLSPDGEEMILVRFVGELENHAKGVTRIRNGVIGIEIVQENLDPLIVIHEILHGVFMWVRKHHWDIGGEREEIIVRGFITMLDGFMERLYEHQTGG